MNKPLFPAVTVNGVTIPSAAIAAEAQNHPAPRGKPGFAWQSAARALILRQLLLEEATRRDLAPDPQERGPGQFETPDEALIRAVTEESVQADAPTDAEVRGHWAQNPDRYVSPPLWEVSHILFSGADGEARARVVAADLLRDPSRFSRIAREVSDCPSRDNGGALGQMSPGDAVPEFEAALRVMAEGEVSPEPVQSRFGWHLIRMDGLAPGRTLPFEAVAPRLAEAMEKARWTRAARDFADRLIGGAAITGITLTPADSEI